MPTPGQVDYICELMEQLGLHSVTAVIEGAGVKYARTLDGLNRNQASEVIRWLLECLRETRRAM